MDLSLPEEQTITRMLPIVRYIAYRNSRVFGAETFDDLFADGSLGLIRAVRTFDPSRGLTLESYARCLIIGAILNGCRKRDPVSERARRTIRRAEDAAGQIGDRLGRQPSTSEIDAEVPGYREALQNAWSHSPVSLASVRASKSAAAAGCSAPTEAIALELMSVDAIRDAVRALPPRLRRVIESHYSYDVSLRQLALEMGLSPQRVSQLHLEALAALRVLITSNATYREARLAEAI